MYKHFGLFLSILLISCNVKESQRGAPRGGYLSEESRKDDSPDDLSQMIDPRINSSSEGDQSKASDNQPPVFLTKAKNITVRAGGTVNMGVYVEDDDTVRGIILKLGGKAGLPDLPIDPDIGILSFDVPENAECLSISGELIAVDTLNNQGKQNITINIECNRNTGEKIQNALKNICQLFKDSLDKEACSEATQIPITQ